MSEKYVCKACGYIYSSAYYGRGGECIDCRYNTGLTKRNTKEALALADAIKTRLYDHYKP